MIEKAYTVLKRQLIETAKEILMKAQNEKKRAVEKACVVRK